MRQQENQNNKDTQQQSNQIQCPSIVHEQLIIMSLYISPNCRRAKVEKSDVYKLYSLSPLIVKWASTYESDSIVIVNNVIKSSAVLKIVCKSHNKM